MNAEDDGQPMGVSYDPPGCYYEGGVLKFNSGQNYGSCSPTDVCVCALPSVDESGNTCATDAGCNYATDGVCDDGGPGSVYSDCTLGTDATDCGYRCTMHCSDTCVSAYDSVCQDGGAQSSAPSCSFGTDCSDCDLRVTSIDSVLPPVPPAPPPASTYQPPPPPEIGNTVASPSLPPPPPSPSPSPPLPLQIGAFQREASASLVYTLLKTPRGAPSGA